MAPNLRSTLRRREPFGQLERLDKLGERFSGPSRSPNSRQRLANYCAARFVKPIGRGSKAHKRQKWINTYPHPSESIVLGPGGHRLRPFQSMLMRGVIWAVVGSLQQNHDSVNLARGPPGPLDTAPKTGRGRTVIARARISASISQNVNTAA
jgi:hypothetical protein